MLITAGSVAESRIPVSERGALLSMFRSTDGDHWKDVTGWIDLESGKAGRAGTECNWSGVTCDEHKSHVSCLILPRNGLRGTIPESISALRKLEVLDLSSNRLQGGVPVSLFTISTLERIDLSGNRLQGSIPGPRTRPVPRLSELNLARNYLQGSIEFATKFAHLKDLDLSSNLFQGCVPKSLGQLSRLEMLDLSRNRLNCEIPDNLGNLSSLKALSIMHNQIRGILPERIGEMSKLEGLDVSFNNLTGELPASFSELHELQYIAADHNRFQGSFMLTCPNSLRWIDLSWNHLRGSLPHALPGCSEILQLRLAHNSIMGNITSEFLQSLPSLESLDLSSNKLSGQLPGEFRNLNDLRALNLTDNRLLGSIDSLRGLDLRELHLDKNQFTGPIEFDSDLMTELTLSSNQFDGMFPDVVCTLTSLRVLDLSNNKLAGNICSNVGDLSDLNALNLSNNNLGGELPQSIGKLSYLRFLVLSINRFTGSLPKDCELHALQSLNLSSNEFGGELPTWFGDLPLLTSLDLHQNRFGSGLQALTNSKMLRFVDLTDNPWTEALPAELGRNRTRSERRTLVHFIDPLILQARNFVSESEMPPKLELPPVAPPPSPQTEFTQLTGTVTDSFSARLPNVTVVAQSPSVVKNTVTDAEGRFTFVLPPGEYQLSFNYPGFKRQIMDRVQVNSGMYNSVEMALLPDRHEETVEVSVKPPEADRGPWWNSWLTRRGAPELASQATLTPNQKYTFYLELSSLRKRDLTNGENSISVEKGLRDHLIKLVKSGIFETSLYLRINVIGRSALLSDAAGSGGEWSPIGWSPHLGSAASSVLNVDLSKLLPDQPTIASTSLPDQAIAARGGAVKFGIDTLAPGCAVIAISIWDDSRSVPLDGFIKTVRVGKQGTCKDDIAERETAPGLYSTDKAKIVPDVSLHIFEFDAGGKRQSATFMVLRSPIGPCESYHWSSDATLVELVLDSGKFKSDLDEARRTSGVYSSIGEQMADAVFPSRRHTQGCGSAEAFAALRAESQQRELRLFARITDQDGRLAIVPVGLLAMYAVNGKRIFAHDFHIIEPVQRESWDVDRCVGNWTFVLPAKLQGVNDDNLLKPPASLVNDSRLVRSKQDFVARFLDLDALDDSPSGLVLLAHHQDGVLTFSGPGDSVAFTRFERELGSGSIAVLSACETANLSGSTKLVGRLNDKGMDAMIAASFELPVDFGARFAYYFADLIAHSKGETVLEDLFDNALSMTINELSKSRGDRARGIGLELVLAGNPKLKICSQPSPK